MRIVGRLRTTLGAREFDHGDDAAALIMLLLSIIGYLLVNPVGFEDQRLTGLV